MKNTSLKSWDVLATGDVFLQTKDDVGNPFSPSIEGLFRKSKVSVINLETTIGNVTSPIEKAYTFNTPIEMASYLKTIGIDIANVANNHTLDYGKEGYTTTLKLLAENKVDVIGTKNRLDNIFCIKEINDVKIGFLAYFGGESSLIQGIDEVNIEQDIIKLKLKNIKYIVVSLHWGEEYVAYPRPKQQILARKIIDFGADIIIGHHPHVAQGIEHYKKGVVFYSLGNFNFNVDHKYHDNLETTKYGFGVKLKFFKTKVCVKYEIIPVTINQYYQTHLLEGEDRSKVIDYIKLLSAPLKSNIGFLFWISQASPHYFKNHLPSYMRRICKYGYKHLMQFLVWLIHPYNYKYYLGLFLSVFKTNSIKIK